MLKNPIGEFVNVKRLHIKGKDNSKRIVQYNYKQITKDQGMMCQARQ